MTTRIAYLAGAVIVLFSLCARAQSDLMLYDDALHSPWIDASWSATVTYGSSGMAYAGTTSIKCETSPWGGLSLHCGAWGTAGISTSPYASLDFEVYSADGAALCLFLENDLGQSFPAYATDPIPAGSWVVESIPMSALNPGGQTINRISIQEVSGSAKTFYIDDVRFAGAQQPPPAGWSGQSGGTTSTLRAVSFANADIGAAVGDGGTILRTTDGGVTWTGEASGTSTMLDGISFGDASTATAVGNGGSAGGPIMRTTDGGSTWTSQSDSTNLPLLGVSFTDAANGTAVGAMGRVFRTTDGGATWSQRINGYGMCHFDAVSFAGAGTGIAVGGFDDLRNPRAILSLTSDGGNNWTDLSNTATPELFGVSAAGPGRWVAVGSGGIILRSTDAGATWGSAASGTSAHLYAVSFGDANTGTAVGAGGVIIRTTDGGATWSAQSGGTTADLFGVSFSDPGTGTAVGAGGVILRTTTGGSGSSVTRVGPESAASAFGLRQNYPNPFNPTTVIDYTLPEEASVSVETYNALGQRISSLVERVQPAGPHTATFNATGLPSGVYFYRLTAHPLSGNRKGAFTDTRRMILAR